MLALGTVSTGSRPECCRRTTARRGFARAVEKVLDGKDLQARVLLVWEMHGGVDAGAEGFLPHGLGGVLECDEDADGGVFAVHIALEGSDHTAIDVAALDLDDDALGLAAVVVEEVDVAVDASVGSAPSVVGRPGVHQTQSPSLKLVAVLLGQGGSAGGVGGLADDLVRG